MEIDFETHRARLSVGEFCDFTLGPRDAGEGPAGVWRAQLGTHWHRQLRGRAEADALQAGAGGLLARPPPEFEVPVEGALPAGRWTIVLNGRIDQILRSDAAPLIREIKTVTRALPEGEAVLRAEYPGYFIQLAAYAALVAIASRRPSAELVFVETATGLTQAVPLAAEDEALLAGQLARVAEFLELRRRARERLRTLRFRPPFAALRPGQETAVADLRERCAAGRAAVLFEAPTGFGKTGVILDYTLGALREAVYERLLYLSGKSSGQIQVARTLETMAPAGEAGGPAVWTVRPKVEHCVNHTFHCIREDCAYLDGVESRWPASGLARFYLFPEQPRDLASLRAAGLEARICPYEITRAALPFNDVWIGDYNYVFAPGSRGIFYRQPGFQPGRTLLVVDEAHNLPSRVADAYSHAFSAAAARETLVLLESTHPRAALTSAWAAWTAFLAELRPSPGMGDAALADARDLIERLAEQLRVEPIEYGLLTPAATEHLWEMPSLADQLAEAELPRLWWSRRAGELSLTCLDAAPAIGETLRQFGGVILASATPGPLKDFAQALGLADGFDRMPGGRPEGAVLSAQLPPAGGVRSTGSASAADKGSAAQPSRGIEGDRLGSLTKRETRKLAKQVVSGAELLRQAEVAEAPIARIVAHAPWREGAYDVAYDLRVDTSFQHRSRHAGLTAAAVAQLARPAGPVAVFFPSYAYAEMIASELAATDPGLRVSLQPRALDLAAQAAWIEQGLAEAHALLLILGSGFAESIDLLGGRISRGMVVGPALPEVNAVQQARLSALEHLGRQAAFRRTYQIPGMQKVNQALGRLVRAPGQRAKVLLHCRRFADPAYHELLAAEYQGGARIDSDESWEAWLARSPEIS